MEKEVYFMNRRAFLVAVAATAGGLAGCQSDQRKSNCPPLLQVHKINESNGTATEEEVTPYQQLSEKRQQEFTHALETGDSELNETVDAWVSTHYVEYESDYYFTGVAVC
ncbi:twin-arginine translocation signal domain-containing protein [Halobacteria archaeon HArc-gm2]|nr:twin-arginine translocation signal domain-containing protein [Halobacteria archaeon HArc-gm2]